MSKFKNPAIWIFICCVAIMLAEWSIHAANIPSDTLVIGTQSATDKKLLLRQSAGESQPGFRFHTATSKVQVSHDGSNFADVADAVPAGAVMSFATAACPAGWILGDGSLVSRSTYAGLYSAIGDTAGPGDGATTFNLPDFRGNLLRGKVGIANVTGSGSASSSNGTFTAHGYNHSGVRVRKSSGTLSGLSASTDYYVIYIDANTLAFATSYANAMAGTKIAISGSNSAVIAQWEDPDASSRLAAGVGGTPGDSVLSRQEDEVKAHTHTFGVFSGPDGVAASGRYVAASGAGQTTNSTGGNDNKVRNVSVIFCVKI